MTIKTILHKPLHLPVCSKTSWVALVTLGYVKLTVKADKNRYGLLEVANQPIL